MPTIETTPDADGAYVSVYPHSASGGPVVSVRHPDVLRRLDDRDRATVRGADRRRVAEALLGEPVLTRSQLLDAWQTQGAAPPGDWEQLLAYARDAAEVVHRVVRERDDAVERLEELKGDRDALEQAVVVTRDMLPAYHGPSPTQGARERATSHRTEALRLLAVAEHLEQLAAAEEARLDPLAEALAAALSHPTHPDGPTGYDLARAVEAAGWLQSNTGELPW